MHIKAETFIKATSYIGGSVGTLLLAIPPSQYTSTRTLIACAIVAILSLLGFMSRNYANYQDFGKVEETGTEVLLAALSASKGESVDSATTNSK